MKGFVRYAIYYAPPPGPLARFGADWLGWDAAAGLTRDGRDFGPLPRPLADLTETPRKYGFHGTVKPPFRLASGTTPDDLHEAAAALCSRLGPVALAGLRLARIGHFLALVPEGDAAPLSALAAEVVTALDAFRAPPTEAEIAHRRPERLSPRQRALLDRWGYPHVMEEFRFHLTLTGPLTEAEAAAVEAALAPQLARHLPRPFVIDQLCLFGEAAEDRRFRLLHRYPLSG